MKDFIFIFDFDGTIADTFHLSIGISNKLADEFHFKKISKDEEALLKDKNSQEIIHYLHIPVYKIPAILLRAREESHKDIDNMHLTTGLKEILLSLKSRGDKLGIYTSNSSANVKKFLKKHEIDFFDFINTSSQIFGKNHGLNRLINQNKFAREKVFYVADETRDVDAAKKSRIKMIAVSWGYNSHTSLKKHNPDYLIDEPKELLTLECQRNMSTQCCKA
ncbi:MAG: HAD-IA family hydrolase [Candidatus Omnitrophica bacterium]|nr:HAD-IA family hydrolase [Candidatus Omnitrophota bacterium]